MDQTVVIGSLIAVTLLGFVLYPRLMFGLVGSLIRGVVSLLMDGIALLFAWI